MAPSGHHLAPLACMDSAIILVPADTRVYGPALFNIQWKRRMRRVDLSQLESAFGHSSSVMNSCRLALGLHGRCTPAIRSAA